MSNINRRAWAEFWAAGKPGERVYVSIDGGLCWLADKAHLYGDPIPVDPLDAYLGVTASFRVPAKRKAQPAPASEYTAALRKMKAAGLPMPPKPFGRRRAAGDPVPQCRNRRTMRQSGRLSQ